MCIQSVEYFLAGKHRAQVGRVSPLCCKTHAETDREINNNEGKKESIKLCVRNFDVLFVRFTGANLKPNAVRTLALCFRSLIVKCFTTRASSVVSKKHPCQQNYASPPPFAAISNLRTLAHVGPPPPRELYHRRKARVFMSVSVGM